MTTATIEKRERRTRRRRRIRSRVGGTAERPRLSVFRSNRGVVAQLVDDERGHTIASVRWFEADLREPEADGAGHARGRAARASGPRRPASRRASSIAAATSTTGA